MVVEVDPMLMASYNQSLPPSLTASDRAKTLISLQSFKGSFPLTHPFASVLEVSLTDLEAKLMEFVPVGTPPEEEKKKLWATVLAVVMFEGKLKGEKEMWELVVEKARSWILGLTTFGKMDVERLEVLAGEVLGA